VDLSMMYHTDILRPQALVFLLAHPHCFQHFTVKDPERSDCITSEFVKAKHTI